MTVLATVGPLPDRQQEITYSDVKIIGNGSFGVVYQAKLLDTNEPVAIKKVLQDKRFKVCTVLYYWYLYMYVLRCVYMYNVHIMCMHFVCTVCACVYTCTCVFVHSWLCVTCTCI